MRLRFSAPATLSSARFFLPIAEISKPSTSIWDAAQGANSSSEPVKILITPAGRSLVARTSAKVIAGTLKPPSTSAITELPETTAAAIASIKSINEPEAVTTTTPSGSGIVKL